MRDDEEGFDPRVLGVDELVSLIELQEGLEEAEFDDLEDLD